MADVLAAGAVVFRPGRQVLLVHRQRYDDWSFPKGKLDRGEHRTAAAVREVEEETGLRIRLGVPLAAQRYPVAQRMKTVYYWVGRVVGDDDVSRYAVNSEIDAVAWVDVDQARAQLTYPHDLATLEDALAVRRRTHTLVVLRHAQARARRTWRADDRERPLLAAGRLDAARLVPILAAYDVRRVVSSTSTRCIETVAPYVAHAGAVVEQERRLTEEDATGKGVARIVAEVRREERPVLICTHRPVLPEVFERLGLEDPRLEPGQLLVVHQRKDDVVGIELHGPR